MQFEGKYVTHLYSHLLVVKQLKQTNMERYLFTLLNIIIGLLVWILPSILLDELLFLWITWIPGILIYAQLNQVIEDEF